MLHSLRSRPPQPQIPQTEAADASLQPTVGGATTQLPRLIQKYGRYHRTIAKPILFRPNG